METLKQRAIQSLFWVLELGAGLARKYQEGYLKMNTVENAQS